MTEAVSPYLAAPTRTLEEFLDGMLIEYAFDNITEARRADLSRWIAEVEAEIFARMK